MKRIETENEIQRSVHLAIVIVNTVLSAAMIFLSFIFEWELWTLPLFAVCAGAAWWLHINQRFSEKGRVVIYTFILMLGIFFYGIHSSGYFDTAVMTVTAMMLFSLTDERIPVNIVFVIYLSITGYHVFIFFTRGSSVENFSAVRVTLYFIAVFISWKLARMKIMKRENERKQSDRLIDELEMMNRRTEDFLANVSHELRTPINVVTGITSVMLKNETDGQKYSDLLSVQQAGDRLMRQISDILDYTEIDTGKLMISDSEYMITSVINDIITDMQLDTRGENIEIVFDVDPLIPSRLIGDSRRIKKILKHLIDNAVKFTQRGGVYIKLCCIEKSYGVNLKIEVTDTGIGMTEEEKSKITGKYYQSDSGKSRYAGGLGLGLSIVSGFVRGMKGFMMIASKPGEGTTVTISLPQKIVDRKCCIAVNDIEKLCVVCYLRPEKYEVPAVREFYNEMTAHIGRGLNLTVHRAGSIGELKKLSEKYRLTHIFMGMSEYERDSDWFDRLDKGIRVVVVSERKLRFPPGSTIINLIKPVYALPVANILNSGRADISGDMLLDTRRPVFAGIRVLVVDDEEMNLIVAKGIFSDYRMEVYTAESGARAIEICRESSFDIIFLDHMMPGMDGIETLHALKTVYTGREKIPFMIALTANAVSGAREMFLSEGFDEFVTKPIETLELERALRKLLPMSAITFEEPELPDAGDDTYDHESGGDEDVSAADGLTALMNVGINIESGIDYCNGNFEFYIELLRNFVKNYPQKSADIRKSFDAKDWYDYRIRVHALKSTAKMIGDMALSDMAAEAENAAKDGKTDYILENNAALLEKYSRDADAIRLSFGSERAESADTDMPMSAEELTEKLVQISECLATFEEARAANIMSELFVYTYGGRPLREILDGVYRSIEDFDMISAAEQIKQLIGKLSEGGGAV